MHLTNIPIDLYLISTAVYIHRIYATKIKEEVQEKSEKAIILMENLKMPLLIDQTH